MAIREAPARELRLDRLMGGRGCLRAHVMERIGNGERVADIAADLQIPAPTLYTWISRWNGKQSKEREAAV